MSEVIQPDTEVSSDYLHAVRIRRGMTPSALALVLARHGVVAAGADVEDWEISGVPVKHCTRVGQALRSLFIDVDENDRKSSRVKSPPSARSVAFGRHLRSLREERGVTRAELGAVIGKTDMSIVHYETGDNKVNLFDAIDIAKHLGVSLAQFTGEIPEQAQLTSEVTAAINRLSQQDKRLTLKLITVVAENR
jgi:DNA-binding XRE family transcriptional regulator